MTIIKLGDKPIMIKNCPKCNHNIYGLVPSVNKFWKIECSKCKHFVEGRNTDEVFTKWNEQKR